MIAEIIVGNCGLYVPVFSTMAFYCTVAAGWRKVLPLFAVLGCVLDLSLGRAVPAQLALLVGTTYLALLWRQYGDCSRAGIQALPGGVVGVFAGGGALLYGRFPGSRLSLSCFWSNSGLFFLAVTGGAVLLPLFCLLLDRWAGKFDFVCFRQIRVNASKHE